MQISSSPCKGNKRGASSMKTKLFFLCLSALLIVSCGSKKKRTSYDTIGDSGLTTRTENLKANLFAYEERGVMIGQMDGTCLAVGEMGDTIKGDIFKIVDDMPAAIGFELKGIESDSTRDVLGVPFSTVRSAILRHFKKQGLIVLEWSAPNYQGNKELLDSYAKKVSNFISSLQDDYGIKVPVLLALYPRGNGEWYDILSPDEYKKMYSQTVKVLRTDTLTNALFAYSGSADFGSTEEFMSYCPDSEIALVQLSILRDKAENYGEELKEKAQAVADYCLDRMMAFGVLGGVRGCDGGNAKFITDNILPTLQTVRMSYFMFGANYGERADGNFYIPYAGTDNVGDFAAVYNEKRTVFLRDLNGLLIDHSEK